MASIRNQAHRSRGVALIVALSVLAILTILVTGLAFSAGAARNEEARSVSAERTSHLARLAFDHAVTTLAASPTQAAGPRDIKLVLPDLGVAVASVRPSTPADTIYSGKFIKVRPGDSIVSILATVQRGKATQKATQTYLLNLTPGQERRIVYEQSVTGMELPKKPVEAKEKAGK